MTKYMHKETGSIASKEDWIDSYNQAELDERGLEAEEAFKADLGKTLFEI